MPKEFYYQLADQVVGPVSGGELRQKAAEGTIASVTLVRVGAEGDWIPASRLKGLFDEHEMPVAAASSHPRQASPPPKPEPLAPDGPPTAVKPRHGNSRLGTCPDCGHAISRSAMSCPECGCWFGAPKTNEYPVLQFIVGLCRSLAVAVPIACVIGLIAVAHAELPNPAELVVSLIVYALVVPLALLGYAELINLLLRLEQNTNKPRATRAVECATGHDCGAEPGALPTAGGAGAEPQPISPEAAAEALGAPVEITNSIGMKLTLIPPDEFLMGSPESEQGRYDNEGPQHLVRITRPFYMGLCQVTQGQYERVMGNNPAHFKESAGFFGLFARPAEPTRPVERVSWNDAIEFCRRLSEQSGQVYRLPTEAEWEYACRAGTATGYYFGDEAHRLAEYAWFTNNSNSQTQPVGRKKPNAFGLFDMHGNVCEWCADWCDPAYYQEQPTSDPLGPTSGADRVVRGGSWAAWVRTCRSAYRQGYPPGFRDDDLGFRVVQVLVE